MHEHPRFLADWTKLLNDRGAHCEGGAEFPSPEQLSRTDVLLIYTADGGDLKAAQREALAALLKRGGGLVTVLDGVCGHDPQWWKTVTGAAWEYGHTKWVYTKLTLRFRDLEHTVTKGATDFTLDDEVYDGLHVIPEAHVLADSEFSPKDAAPKSIPQVWALEKGSYRAFTVIPGMRYTTFSVPSYRALLLRGIAWAGRREKVDEFCLPEELAALRGVAKP
jgi:type 1 glutamine amidotransferase